MAGMIWVARGCGCVHEQVLGKKRPKKCECGNVFERPQLEEARRERARNRPARRPSEPDRYWDDARAKVEHEECCRICKKPAAFGRPLEAAHVLGREHDEPRISPITGEPLKELYVHPNRTFPACGPFPNGCHGDAEYRRINVLPYLSLEEQLQAVRDADGIEAARIRLAPVEHREEVERSAAA